MARITIDAAVGEEIVGKLLAPGADRGSVARSYMQMLGWSRGTFYRIARQFGFRGFSKERADKGERKVSLDVVHLMGAICQKPNP